MLACLVLQTTIIILLFCERKRTNRKYTAMLEYIDRVNDGTCGAFESELNEYQKENNARFDKTNARVEEAVLQLNNKLSCHCEHTKEQLKNMALDFEQAQNAAQKINDFGASLANIFDYDPLAAIQKNRRKEVV
jgi:hypothetical protein